MVVLVACLIVLGHVLLHILEDGWLQQNIGCYWVKLAFLSVEVQALGPVVDEVAYLVQQHPELMEGQFHSTVNMLDT